MVRIQARQECGADGEDFAKAKTKRGEITPSSGNVFADLGLPDAETLLLKANLAVDIEEIVQRRRLTRAKAAKMLGLSQSELADILGGVCGTIRWNVCCVC